MRLTLGVVRIFELYYEKNIDVSNKFDN